MKHLQIASRYLKKIGHYAFQGLDKLKILDLSNNVALNLHEVTKALRYETILPSLSELYLSNMSVEAYMLADFYIDSDFLHANSSKRLKVLDISKTGHARFYWNRIGENNPILTAFPWLEKLNISNTGLAFMTLENPFLYTNKPEVTSFKSLIVYDMRYPRLPSVMSDAGMNYLVDKDVVVNYSNINIRELLAKGFFFYIRTKNNRDI